MDPVVEPVTPDPAAIAPPVEPVVEPVVEATPEPAPAPIVDPKQPPKWALERISEETRKRQASEERATAAERRAQEAEALAQRIQNGQQPQPRTEPAPVDMNLVNQVANQQRMTEARSEIIRNGYATFGGQKFDEAANILGAVGCVSDDFIADVLAVDRPNAHKTLAALAAEPETAARLANLDSRSRIAELTRLQMKAAAPTPVVEAPKAPPAKVSKAPAPPPPVEPSASKTIDGYSDEATDEQFTKQFNERMKARAGLR